MNINLNNIEEYKLSERLISDDMYYLDWNEGLPLPSIHIKKILSRLDKINFYTNPKCSILREKLSKYTGVDKSFIEVSNGSDSALDMSLKVLLNKNDIVCIPFPNYSQINQTLSFIGAKTIYFPIDEIEKNLNKIKPKVVYLSNPNNPIGYTFNIKPLILKYPEIFFVVDEAYFEYNGNYSVFSLAQKVKNLIVTRTFSKAMGLAGIRLGYFTSNTFLLESIRKIKNFKEVNRLAEVSAIYVLENIHLIKQNVDIVIKNKNQFINNLNSEIRVYDSNVNFVLIQHPDVQKIITKLKENQILIRDRSDFIKNSARITIGENKIMSRVAKIINSVIS
jgi:histidinol-phosphate aminotransferase